MKKNIEKILASASAIVALVLIVILVVTAFGGITPEEFDNELVQGLIVTLGALYLLLTAATIAMIFAGSDAVREITLRSEQGGNCKATLGVIRKLVKETFSGIQGVRMGKVSLIVNEYGVKLRVAVRITDRDVFETETYLRTLLEEVFKGALGFKFHTIEFKVVSLQARFKPDAEKVEAAVAEKVAEHTPNYAVIPNMVESAAPADETPADETPAEAIPEAAEAVAEEAVAESVVATDDVPEQIPEENADVSDEEDAAEEEEKQTEDEADDAE